MSPTFVYTRGGGRLGNQLLNYANLLAFTLEYPSVDVLDLAFVPYRDVYGNDQMNLATVDGTSLPGAFGPIIEYGWENRLFKQVLDFGPFDRFRVQTLHLLADVSSNSQSIIRGHPHTSYRIPGIHCDQLDLAETDTLETFQSRDVSVVAGWAVRGWPLVRKHRSEIRSRMQPGDTYLSAAKSYVSDLRDHYDHLVGVLVRQQDYRTWHDGDYFFESERYEEFLSAYADEYPDGKVGFLIASDEEQPSTVFRGDQYNFATGEAVGPNHYLESFAELSICDSVLTPPSTFSTVAAFLGDTPLVPLYEGVLDDGWTHLNEPLLQSLEHSEMSESVK